MENFPGEVLFGIISLLPPEDVARLRRVCKYLLDFICKHDQVHKLDKSFLFFISFAVVGKDGTEIF